MFDAADNAWVAFGGSITTAILNGGPPGIIYELLAACFYYGYVLYSFHSKQSLSSQPSRRRFIAASLAELASSIPSAGGGKCLYLTSVKTQRCPR